MATGGGSGAAAHVVPPAVWKAQAAATTATPEHVAFPIAAPQPEGQPCPAASHLWSVPGAPLRVTSTAATAAVGAAAERLGGLAGSRFQPSKF